MTEPTPPALPPAGPVVAELAPAAPPPATAAAIPVPAQETLAERLRRATLVWAVLASALALFALLAAVMAWQKVNGMQEALARQSLDINTRAVEARTLAQQAQELAAQAAARTGAMETRVGELSAQRAQVETLMARLSSVRDDTLLADIESAMRLAQGQTQLTGNVTPLLAALRSAEQRIGRSAHPRAPALLAAIRSDIERVQSASVVDSAAVLNRLDDLIRQVDDLPAMNALPAAMQASPSGPAPAEPPTSGLGRLWASVVREASALVSVDRIEYPDAALLTREQTFFLRENLKLRLLNARLGVLARQPEAVQGDLAAAASLVKTYFAPSSRRTQTAAHALQQVQALARDIAVPEARATMAALAQSTP